MSKRLRKKYPNLFLLGAAKAGSSFIHAQLSFSKDIYASPYKEPAYFFYRGFKTAQAYDRQVPLLKEQYDEKAYLRLFKKWSDEAYCIDASTHYLQGQDCPKRIHEAVPHAKMIAVIREPVARAYSQYLMNFRWGRVREDFQQAMQKEHEEEKIASTPTATHYSFLRQSMYLKPFQEYFRYFGLGQFRVYKFEDVTNKLPEVMDDMGDFLDINLSCSEVSEDSKNTFKAERWPLMSNALNTYHSLPFKPAINALLPRKARDTIRNSLTRAMYKDAKKPVLNDEARSMIMEYVKNDYPDALEYARSKRILFET